MTNREKVYSTMTVSWRCVIDKREVISISVRVQKEDAYLDAVLES